MIYRDNLCTRTFRAIDIRVGGLPMGALLRTRLPTLLEIFAASARAAGVLLSRTVIPLRRAARRSCQIDVCRGTHAARRLQQQDQPVNSRCAGGVSVCQRRVRSNRL